MLFNWFEAAEAATIADKGGARVEIELLEIVLRLGTRDEGGRVGGIATPRFAGWFLERERETAPRYQCSSTWLHLYTGSLKNLAPKIRA